MNSSWFGLYLWKKTNRKVVSWWRDFRCLNYQGRLISPTAITAWYYQSVLFPTIFRCQISLIFMLPHGPVPSALFQVFTVAYWACDLVFSLPALQAVQIARRMDIIHTITSITLVKIVPAKFEAWHDTTVPVLRLHGYCEDNCYTAWFFHFVLKDNEWWTTDSSTAEETSNWLPVHCWV